MADAVTNFSALSNDAPNVYIERQTFRIAERQMVLGSFATRYSLPQRMGKSLRVVRHKRMAAPNAPLTEGVPPDAVALAIENVDVTVEQWGIVALLTDVALITTTHPALQVAIDRTGLAMTECLEREIAQVLLGGTSVYFPGAITARGNLAATDKLTSAVVLKATVSLRAKGAAQYQSGLYGGVMAPQQEGDIVGSDTLFQGAAQFSEVRKLEYAEIGKWMDVSWKRGNYLPVFKGVPAPDTSATTAEKAQVSAVAGARKVTVVAKDANSFYERKISVQSAVVANTATITMPSSTNYVYDVYTDNNGSGAFKRVIKNAAAGFVSAALDGLYTASTETLNPPANPASGVEVYVAWVFGKDAFGRVELNGMSLESYITPAGSSWANPLAQGRKVGSKLMWKCFLLDNAYFARIETGSSFASELPA